MLTPAKMTISGRSGPLDHISVTNMPIAFWACSGHSLRPSGVGLGVRISYLESLAARSADAETKGSTGERISIERRSRAGFLRCTA
jgi:hypothetical protein